MKFSDIYKDKYFLQYRAALYYEENRNGWFSEKALRRGKGSAEFGEIEAVPAEIRAKIKQSAGLRFVLLTSIDNAELTDIYRTQAYGKTSIAMRVRFGKQNNFFSSRNTFEIIFVGARMDDGMFEMLSESLPDGFSTDISCDIGEKVIVDMRIGHIEGHDDYKKDVTIQCSDILVK